MTWEGADGYRAVCEAWSTSWRPRRPMSVAQWAQQRRRLSAKGSAEAGRWENSRIPFLVGVMDALDAAHPAGIVVFIKSSQVGATEAGLNWVGWTMDESPVPMLALFPGEKLGKRWTRLRLEPMIAETPTLRAAIPLGRRADKGDTLMEKQFTDGHLTIGSANIPSDLASIAVARLLLDEVDRFPKEVGEEGDPIEIALRRMATFGARAKAFLNSSPTIESLSHINPWWKQSSQGHYYVPCPDCGEKQVLVWENLIWPEGKPQEAKYRCTHCEAMISEHHKTDMLAGGEWRHEFPERCETTIGFHVNCLYTPIGLGDSWAVNAAVYERSKRDPSKLKAFTNTRLGETHEDPTEKLDWETLSERREPFSIGSVPRGALVLTCGVDVQRDRLEVQMIGWGRDETAWTVDYVQQPGDPTREDVWKWLDDYLAKPVVNECGVAMRVTSCAIDAGFLQHDVMNFVRDKRSRNIFATKGQPQFGRQILTLPTKVDIKHSGRVWKRGAELYPLGQSTAKQTLYERLRADGLPDPEKPDQALRAAMRHVHFSRDLPTEYFRQLASQVFDPLKRIWVNTYERDEALDTFILAMAAAMHHSTHVHRFNASDWARLEALYEPAEKRDGPKEQAIGAVPMMTPTGGFIPMRAVVHKREDD